MSDKPRRPWLIGHPTPDLSTEGLEKIVKEWRDGLTKEEYEELMFYYGKQYEELTQEDE